MTNRHQSNNSQLPLIGFQGLDDTSSSPAGNIDYGAMNPPYGQPTPNINPVYPMSAYGQPSNPPTHDEYIPSSINRDIGFAVTVKKSDPTIEPTPTEDHFDEDDVKRVKFRDGKRKIDYILAYETSDPDEMRRKNRSSKRELFEKNLKLMGLELEREDIENSADGKTIFIKIHIPWKLLCKIAEEMKLKMPLKSKSTLFSALVTFDKLKQENSLEVFDAKKEDANVKEVEMDVPTFSEKIIDKLCCCCSNPFALSEDDIPDINNCYTMAFRRDRMDKFVFPDNPEDFFNSTHRARLVYHMLSRCRYDDRKYHQIGINRLLSNGSYTAAYPLHDGPFLSEYSLLTHKLSNDRQLLYYHWARPGRWFKEQPIDLIRKYFGEKIGLYFAWLGLYTGMLFPAALMGLTVIIYGLATMGDYSTITDVCERKANFPMCPKCDQKCQYTDLSESCLYTKVTYIIDNPFTVAFAVFMSFWATFFLEFWKRKQAEIQYDWDLMGFEDEEERPRPEFEAAVQTTRLNPITLQEEPYLPNSNVCPRYTVAINCILLMIVLVVVAIVSVVVYRIAVYAAIATTSSLDITWVGFIASSTAALLNLIAIMLLNKLYERFALFLTEWEMPKTQTMFDDLFTFKMYMFQFVNFYGSLFYIAFFKLTPGTPKTYNRIFELRREECNPVGCLFELGLQLFVIMVGKQVFNNFIEIIVPKLKTWWRKRANVLEEESSMSQWEHDYNLVERTAQGLFYEYLEMVIQYGFITIFVAAFPLGPLFALINNLIEIRVDAYKFTTIFRRPDGDRSQDIGIWYEILSGISKLSVVANAFVIGFVSEFVPRLYYQLSVSDDNSLDGFLNSTLSCFDINDFDEQSKPKQTFDPKFNNSCGFGKQTCRYRGYFEPPYLFDSTGNLTSNPRAYEFSPAHWHVIAGRLFFVIVFEHLVFAISNFIAWVVPDVPKALNHQIKRENYLAKEAIRGETRDDRSDTASVRNTHFQIV